VIAMRIAMRPPNRLHEIPALHPELNVCEAFPILKLRRSNDHCVRARKRQPIDGVGQGRRGDFGGKILAVPGKRISLGACRNGEAVKGAAPLSQLGVVGSHLIEVRAVRVKVSVVIVNAKVVVVDIRSGIRLRAAGRIGIDRNEAGVAARNEVVSNGEVAGRGINGTPNGVSSYILNVLIGVVPPCAYSTTTPPSVSVT
jgi:hypothetical protein